MNLSPVWDSYALGSPPLDPLGWWHDCCWCWQILYRSLMSSCSVLHWLCRGPDIQKYNDRYFSQSYLSFIVWYNYNEVFLFKFCVKRKPVLWLLIPQQLTSFLSSSVCAYCGMKTEIRKQVWLSKANRINISCLFKNVCCLVTSGSHCIGPKISPHIVPALNTSIITYNIVHFISCMKINQI